MLDEFFVLLFKVFLCIARLSAEVGETQRPETIESEEGSSNSHHTGLFAERRGFSDVK